MKYQLSVRKAAEQDMAEAFDFYESQQTDLGIRFHNEVAEVLRRIESNPALYASTDFPGYRGAVLQGFPFCIYYYVAEERIAVIAVLDSRRNPKIWRERAKR